VFGESVFCFSLHCKTKRPVIATLEAWKALEGTGNSFGFKRDILAGRGCGVAKIELRGHAWCFLGDNNAVSWGACCDLWCKRKPVRGYPCLPRDEALDDERPLKRVPKASFSSVSCNSLVCRPLHNPWFVQASSILQLPPANTRNMNGLPPLAVFAVSGLGCGILAGYLQKQRHIKFELQCREEWDRLEKVSCSCQGGCRARLGCL